MKTTILFTFSLAVALFFQSCTSTTAHNAELAPISLTGEFLFEGPNTLQVENNLTLSDIMAKAGLKGVPASVEVKKASLDLSGVDADWVESATLQVSSKNLDMITIGTISILNGEATGITLAEETNIQPYVEDEEMYWVLDVNLTSDLDDLSIPLELQLTINQ